MGHRRRPLRLVVATVALVAAMAVLAGCSVPRPSGDGTIRYRDQVFSAVMVTKDLQYGSAPGSNGNPVALKLDLYRPTGDTQTKRPAVIFVHGGGYCCGDKASGVSPDLATKFAKLGYVTASINYRLLAPNGCTGAGGVSNECTVAAVEAQHDAQAAVRWMRANATTYGIDTTRIGIGGESAGAITATLVGVHSEDVGSSGNPGLDSKVRAFMSISGGVPSGLFAGAGDAAGLLFHGTADGIVPYQWSLDVTSALFKAGVPVFIETQQGAGHVPYGQYSGLFFEQSDYFFYLFMDVGHAAGQPPAVRRAADRERATYAKRYPALKRRFGPALQR